MNEGRTEDRKDDIKLEYEFTEPPQKVWRAISIPEFRQHWLPNDALADPEATSIKPNEEVSYRMRDNAPPFLESTVTFKIAPNATGGTSLRITHELTDIRLGQMTMCAANSNNKFTSFAA
jgi:uncharacterized protein YndB with AHSA1/START domain